MGKTIQVAADRESDKEKTVLPTEFARGVYIENSPGLQALKLMHLLIAIAGPRMADDVVHEMRLSEISQIEGMRKHSRPSLRALFIELRAAVIAYDNTEEQAEIIGGFLDEAQIDYRHEVSGNLLVKWWFGRAFRRIAAASNHWAILDRPIIFVMNSKYSILLFQHIATLANLDYVKSKTFTIPELRAILGVPAGKLDRFSNLTQKAINPAIAEINSLSRFTLEATPNKIGHTVVSVTIGWQVEEDPRPAKHQMTAHSAGREGTVETIAAVFPETGSITYSPHWLDLKHAAGCNTDNAKIATDFRRFLADRGIARDARNIEKLFADFCRKAGKSNPRP